MGLHDAYVRYLTEHRQGRLATVGPDGVPQVKPVGYRYNAETGTIDISGFNMERSAKYRNVAVRPQIAFVVDDAIGEGAENMHFVEIRGPAQQAMTPTPAAAGVSQQIIRIYPRRVVSWNVDPSLSGMQARDVGPYSEEPTQTRPTLSQGQAGEAAREAVVQFVAELQAGLDRRDADVYNRHFAEDVIWGSPYGAVIHGYAELHAIHARFNSLPEQPGGPRSRYEVVQVTTPAPGVALAQVRRQALDPEGEPLNPTADPTGAFSEMALYVLVHREQTWWLAAGQNTLVGPRPT
jgi:PPOX class F420-dependent enzyme/OxyR family protein/uncharacterized protein (TIGR02246 family)